MKRVFNNAELSHVWASQKQSTGRGNNMFFQGDTIYSYGNHYAIAKMYAAKGLVLINSKGYSNTTAKHTRHVARAVTHLETFYVPNVYDARAPENVTHLANRVADCITSFISSRRGYSYQLETILKAVKNFNDYCYTFNINDSIRIDDETLADLQALLVEKVEKRKEFDAATTERLKVKNALREAEYLESVEKWKVFLGPIKGYSSKVFLRINFNEQQVETSRGAIVPLKNAIDLFKKIKNNEAIKGLEIGHYTVKGIENETLVIGCHNIPLSEANSVMNQLVNL